MASLESLLTRSLVSETMSGRVVDDKGIALEIVFAPTYTFNTTTGLYTADATITGPNEVVVTSATDIVLTNSAETITCTFATNSTTLGETVDRINASKYWRARIIDGLRSTLTASSVLIPNTAITAVSEVGESRYKIYFDTAILDTVFYRVALDRGVLINDVGQAKDNMPKGGHRVKITGINFYEHHNGTEQGAVRIYEYDPRFQTETLVWAGASGADNTATSFDFTLNPITSAEGNDLVVMFTDSTSITKASTDFMQVDYIRE